MLTQEQEARLKEIMASKDPSAMAEFLGGVIMKKLFIENWLDACLDQAEGNEFLAPYDVIGKIAEHSVRGSLPQSFTVSRRKVYLTEQRYTSAPEMDTVDLQRGDIAQLSDLITEAKLGLTDLIMLDAYNLMMAKVADGSPNFYVIVDDGTLQAGQSVPQVYVAIRRKIDEIMYIAEDVTRQRTLKSIIGRKIMLGDAIINGVTSFINKAVGELTADLVPGTYRNVNVVTLSGVTDRSGNLAFPKNEIFCIGQGAGAYSIFTDVQVNALPPMNFRQKWEILTERIIAIWFPNLIWRIVVMDLSHGHCLGLLDGSPTQVMISIDKYASVGSITPTTIKVYTGGDPGAGVAGQTFTATVDPNGKVIYLNFAAPLAPGTYRVYNTNGVLDVGTTTFNATTHGAPIGTFTV